MGRSRKMWKKSKNSQQQYANRKQENVLKEATIEEDLLKSTQLEEENIAQEIDHSTRGQKMSLM